MSFFCKETLKKNPGLKNNLILVDKAISEKDGKVKFYPFDLKKHNNPGASSMLKIDFSMRNNDDPSKNEPNPQYEIEVDGTRLDTFIESEQIENVDMMCIDLQGYELQALRSLGKYLKQVKYIITECSIQNTYTGGANFIDFEKFLNENGFIYKYSDKYGPRKPNLNKTGYSEFNALFINSSL